MTQPQTKLIIEDDAGKTIVVPFARDEITIGRKEGNTIRLTERNVSRFHAKLVREGNAVHVEDLKSYNGVKINGDVIKGKVEVREGDLIEIGDYHLALQGAGAQETTEINRPPVDQFAGDTQRVDPSTLMPPYSSDKTSEGSPALLDSVNDMPTQQSKDLTEDFEPTEASPIPTPVSMDNAPESPVEPPRARDLPTLEPVRSKMSTPSLSSHLTDNEEATEALIRAPGPSARSGDRLVAINTIFAGTVWALDKDEMVMGRTEDNELRIQHKSVSRHHAKIVCEGGKVRIVDLGSSNGVLVNDVERANAELENGDVIELGRVRLRFVPRGMQFGLSQAEIDQARLADENGGDDDFMGTSPSVLTVAPKKPVGVLLAMGAVILALLGVIAFLILRDKGDATPTDPIEVVAKDPVQKDPPKDDPPKDPVKANPKGIEKADPLLTNYQKEATGKDAFAAAKRFEALGDFEKALDAAIVSESKGFASAAGLKKELQKKVAEKAASEMLAAAKRNQSVEAARKIIEKYPNTSAAREASAMVAEATEASKPPPVVKPKKQVAKRPPKKRVPTMSESEATKKAQSECSKTRWRACMNVVEKYYAQGGRPTQKLNNAATLAALSSGDCRKAERYSRRASKVLQSRVASQCR